KIDCRLAFDSNFRELAAPVSASGSSALLLGLCVSTIQNEKQLSSHRKYDEEIIGASEARLSRLRHSRGSHSGRRRFGGWPQAPECPKQQIADCCGESCLCPLPAKKRQESNRREIRHAGTARLL